MTSSIYFNMVLTTLGKISSFHDYCKDCLCPINKNEEEDLHEEIVFIPRDLKRRHNKEDTKYVNTTDPENLFF